mmetsp:Transcript_582/g.1288  ORF Transcript_582/g.1288 Transcript_582/m.1288 type:complete len:235 (+) Transcript_582:863-1567(+)
MWQDTGALKGNDVRMTDPSEKSELVCQIRQGQRCIRQRQLYRNWHPKQIPGKYHSVVSTPNQVLRVETELSGLDKPVLLIAKRHHVLKLFSAVRFHIEDKLCETRLTGCVSDHGLQVGSPSVRTRSPRRHRALGLLQLEVALEACDPLGDQLQPLMALMILQLPLGQGREGRDATEERQVHGDIENAFWTPEDGAHDIGEDSCQLRWDQHEPPHVQEEVCSCQQRNPREHQPGI